MGRYTGAITAELSSVHELWVLTAHHAPLTPGFRFWLDSWHVHFNVKIPQKRKKAVEVLQSVAPPGGPQHCEVPPEEHHPSGSRTVLAKGPFPVPCSSLCSPCPVGEACRSELSPRRATPLIPHLSQQIQDTRSTFLFQGKSDFLQSLAFTLAPLILQAVCFTCDKFVFL